MRGQVLVVKRLLLGYVGEILISCLIVSWESILGKLYAYLKCNSKRSFPENKILIFLPIRKIETND